MPLIIFGRAYSNVNLFYANSFLRICKSFYYPVKIVRAFKHYILIIDVLYSSICVYVTAAVAELELFIVFLVRKIFTPNQILTNRAIREQINRTKSTSQQPIKTQGRKIPTF